MKENTVEIFGYPVYGGNLESLEMFEHKTVINTLNAYSYAVAKKDKLFKDALMSSDVLLADGFPVVLAARLLRRKKISKIAGADIFLHLLKIAEKHSWKCFFLGSDEHTLQLISNRLSTEYPHISAGFYSPPFVDVFSEKEIQQMIQAVNQHKPEILFVGMTAPKQEKWVYQNKIHINAKVIGSIGAVFGFYAGTISRPSAFWIKLKLEWFIRFVKEPRRLWKRYFIYSPVFFFDLLKFRILKK